MAWDTENTFLKNAPWGHGVILFFVLSGYLISNILFELKEKIDSGLTTHSSALKAFYFRRFLRIFPIYYLLLFYLYSINYNNTREIFPWLVTYTSNLLQCKTGSFVGDFNHFWSLAVEEQFYILWPFLILFIDQKKVFKLILIFMAFSFLSRTTCVIVADKNWMWGAYFTPNLFLPLALGALIAYAKRYKPQLEAFFLKNIWLYGSLAFYIIAYYFLHHQYNSKVFSTIFDEYLFSFVSAFFIAKASSNGFKYLGKRILEHDVVVFTGTISYGLYVYHLFMVNFFWYYLVPEYHLGVENKHAMWVVYFAIAYGLAILSYYIIEKPIGRLKSYFNY